MVRCNGTVTKQQLCFIGEEYDKSFLIPEGGFEALEKQAAKIWSSVEVLEISEFDENRQTITLDLVLSIWWYDPRLTIESNLSPE